jgi:hypothetical protein
MPVHRVLAAKPADLAGANIGGKSLFDVKEKRTIPKLEVQIENFELGLFRLLNRGRIHIGQVCNDHWNR